MPVSRLTFRRDDVPSISDVRRAFQRRDNKRDRRTRKDHEQSLAYLADYRNTRSAMSKPPAFNNARWIR
jgi:hypothetical protein